MSNLKEKIPVLCLVLVLAITCYSTFGVAAAPDLTKPEAGRLRAGYMGGKNFKVLGKMAQNGMNAAIPSFGSIPEPIPEFHAALLRKWADECSRRNLAFMPAIYWWGGDEARRFKYYNHVVTEKGQYLANTPCPYTRDFWDRCITPRFLAVCRAVGGRPLAAVCVDMEMYGGDHTGYERGCYCDGCFARYLQAKGLPGKLPAPADRGKTIKEAGELDRYQAVQREAARTFAVACREAVHKARPGLRLGALHLDHAIPILQGIALGFGTPDLPVFCLTEKTYWNGHTTYIASAQESFRKSGAFVDLLVGIWQSRFPPENIAEQLYHCAQDSNGYWIYTMETFEKPDYHPLAGAPEEYWAGIRKANLELDKMEADANFRTALRIRPFKAPPPPLPYDQFHKYDLFPPSGKKLPVPSVRIRGTNWIYFHAMRGDRIEFEATQVQIGANDDSTRVGLMSPTGGGLAEITVMKDRPAVLRAVAPVTGIYGIVVVAGAGAAEMTRTSHPYAVHIASPGLAGFVTRLPLLYVVPSPDADRIEFEFETDSGLEAVKGTVLAENGAELWAGVVGGRMKAAIDKPAGSLVVLKFERLPGNRVAGVRVRGVKGVLPFAATDPAGLFFERPTALQVPMK